MMSGLFSAISLVLNLVTIISLFIIQMMIKNYIGSYVKKKGENLATKEDIGLITKEIEIVKSSIQVSTHGEISFISQKQLCLLQYNSEFIVFWNELDQLGNEYHIENEKYFFEPDRQITVAYNKLLVSEANAKIFFWDNLEIKFAGLELRNHLSETLFDVKDKMLKVCEVNNGKDKNTPLEKYNLIKDILKEMRMKKLENYKKFLILYDKFSDLSYHTLRSSSKK